ncbi:hypothetical protein E2C01_002457 [Portunus trituberculatus]|uniref:Uncharacterized protein n=1 Tax=Portunus trituberculatus TaxID=210409 RepID=A0A5B7CKF7_PORTR|nr:hypothetical protein [Portunus trituberculatus]
MDSQPQGFDSETRGTGRWQSPGCLHETRNRHLQRLLLSLGIENGHVALDLPFTARCIDRGCPKIRHSVEDGVVPAAILSMHPLHCNETVMVYVVVIVKMMVERCRKQESGPYCHHLKQSDERNLDCSPQESCHRVDQVPHSGLTPEIPVTSVTLGTPGSQGVVVKGRLLQPQVLHVAVVGNVQCGLQGVVLLRSTGCDWLTLHNFILFTGRSDLSAVLHALCTGKVTQDQVMDSNAARKKKNVTRGHLGNSGEVTVTRTTTQNKQSSTYSYHTQPRIPDMSY